MEEKLQAFILSNLKELEVRKQGVVLNCTLQGRSFSISPEGGLLIQGEVFDLPEGKGLYEAILGKFRERIVSKFLNGTVEEPGYEW